MNDLNAENTAKEIEGKLGYRFKDTDLLRTAFTHLSYANEKNLDYNDCYEKLEFLGDAVLQTVVSDFLFRNFPAFNEGRLTRLRSRLVSEDHLHKVAEKLNLGAFVLLGNGEERGGGRGKPSILSDVAESLFGAVYTDSREESGIQTIAGIIETLFKESIAYFSDIKFSKDYRSLLNELAVKHAFKNLEYRCVKEEGRDHEKNYTYGVYINGELHGLGNAGNKKRAAAAAAGKTLEKLGYLEKDPARIF